MYKKLLLSLALLFYLSANFSQNLFDYTFHHPHSSIKAIAIDSTNNIVSVGSSQACPKGLIAFFDSTGNIQWDIQLNANPKLTIAKEVYFDSNGNITVIGTHHQIDDFRAPTDGLFFYQLTPTGAPIVFKELIGGAEMSSKLFAVNTPSNNHIVVHQPLEGGAWLFSILDSMGEGNMEKELELIDVRHLSLVNDSTLLLAGGSSVQLLDLEGTVRNSVQLIDLVTDVKQVGNSIWVLGSGSLIHLSQNLETLATINIPNSANFKTEGLIATAFGLTIWGTSGDTEKAFLDFENNSWQLSFLDPKLGSSLLTAEYKDETFYFAGENTWETNTQTRKIGGGFISSFPDQNIVVERIPSDISIEGIYINQLGAIDTFDILERNGVILAMGVTYAFEGTFEIRNNGQFLIESLVIGSSWQGGFNCTESRVFGAIDSVSIVPGGSEEVTLGFTERTFLLVGEENLLDRCFFVEAPNNTFDDNLSNNVFCQVLLTNTKERLLSESKVSIYPNPASKEITIEIDQNSIINSISLFDIGGQMIQRFARLDSYKSNIPVFNLQRGLYIMRIETPNGVINKKILLN